MKVYLSKIILLVSLLAFSTAAFCAKEMNAPAPDFTLKSLSGKNLRLSELAGQVVLLNFWASWCAPCREEMPILNDLHNKYSALGFTVLGVNVEEQTDKAVSYIADRPVDFPILLDNKNNVSSLYEVIAMPTTVLIDRNGTMRYLHQGYKAGDEKEYVKLVKKLVRE